MIALLNLLVAVSPYFTALVLLPLPSNSLGLHEYWHTNLTFIGTFLLFEFSLFTVTNFSQRPRSKNFKEKLVNFGHFIVTATSLILTLGMLSIYNERFSHQAFYGLLCLWPVRSLCFILAQRQKDLLALPAILIYSTAAAFFSFYVHVGVFQWQALVLSLAVGFVVSSNSLAGLIFKCRIHEQKNRQLSKLHLWCLRLYPVFLNLGPMLVGILPILDQLARSYMTTLVIVPLSLVPTNSLRAAESGSVLKPRFLLITSGISLLFMSILWFARLLG